MNDRFAAELRHHLLESADERPADGQLAAVVDAVAGTSQRTPLAARLTWNPGRIGPVPSAAIRYGLVAAALALAMVAGALLGGGGSRQPSTVFEGTWITIDPADGSGMTLVVGPGQTPDVYFEDGYASGAACVNDQVKRFTARGTGELSGNHLLATYPDGGGCGLETVGSGGRYDYDEGSDTLTDQDGVVWTRALPEQPPETAPPLSTPEPTPPSERPREVTFTSVFHGISFNYPDTWQAVPAIEPWTGGELTSDTPSADLIHFPMVGEDPYLAVASQPYGALTQDAWRNQGNEWICPDGGAFGSVTVDGADAWAVACGSQQGVFIFTDTRGYVIRLVVPSSQPALAEAYNWDWLKLLLETVDLRPEEAIDAAPVATLDPVCVDLANGGTYTAHAGPDTVPADPLWITATVPDQPAIQWQGSRDWFHLVGGCGSGPQVSIFASTATEPLASSCMRGNPEIASFADAVARLDTPTGEDISARIDLTIDGHPAARYDVTDLSTCPGFGLWSGTILGAGETGSIYVIDVDGELLGIELNWSSLGSRSGIEEAYAIVETLQFGE